MGQSACWPCSGSRWPFFPVPMMLILILLAISVVMVISHCWTVQTVCVGESFLVCFYYLYYRLIGSDFVQIKFKFQMRFQSLDLSYTGLVLTTARLQAYLVRSLPSKPGNILLSWSSYILSRIRRSRILVWTCPICDSLGIGGNILLGIKISLFGFQPSLNPKHFLSISSFFLGCTKIFYGAHYHLSTSHLILFFSDLKHGLDFHSHVNIVPISLKIGSNLSPISVLMWAFREKINAWLVKYILKYNVNKSELLNWNMQLSDVFIFFLCSTLSRSHTINLAGSLKTVRAHWLYITKEPFLRTQVMSQFG